MDILELIKKDHQEVMGLFEKLSAGDGKKEKEFGKLRDELTAHTKAEEKVLYKALQSDADTREMILEAYEEHHVAALVLRELDKNSGDGERWHAKLKVLQEMVQHHAQEEEGELFQKTQQAVPATKLQEMGSKFEEEKKKILKK